MNEDDHKIVIAAPGISAEFHFENEHQLARGLHGLANQIRKHGLAEAIKRIYASAAKHHDFDLKVTLPGATGSRN